MEMNAHTKKSRIDRTDQVNKSGLIKADHLQSSQLLLRPYSTQFSSPFHSLTHTTNLIVLQDGYPELCIKLSNMDLYYHYHRASGLC